MAENHRPPISPEAATGYMERWARAEQRLVRERRATSMETRLHQLAALMAPASAMGWSGALDDEDDAVRERWMAVRRAVLAEEPAATARPGTSTC